jgi:hypothetical protein
MGRVVVEALGDVGGAVGCVGVWATLRVTSIAKAQGRIFGNVISHPSKH